MPAFVEHNVKLVQISPCSTCIHKYSTTLGCPAFPDGIPDDITFGNNLHTEIYPGQKGTVIYERE